MAYESYICVSSKLSSNPIVAALDSSLSQCIKRFKDLTLEYEQVLIDNENCKNMLLKQKAACESKTCSGAEYLQKDVVNKDNTIKLIGFHITKLHDTRNWSHIHDIIKILRDNSVSIHSLPPEDDKRIPGESTDTSSSKNTPVENHSGSTKVTPENSTKNECLTPKNRSPKKLTTPKEEAPSEIFEPICVPNIEQSSLEDISSYSSSSPESLEKPRAKSPIFKSNGKKCNGTSVTRSSKKKCLDSWKESPIKRSKIEFPKITTNVSGKNKGQKKLQLRFLRNSYVTSPPITVDLTDSPDTSLSGDTSQKLEPKSSNSNPTTPVRTTVKREKQESCDKGDAEAAPRSKSKDKEICKLELESEILIKSDDETILPSPTSHPTAAYVPSKTTNNKENQAKFKRPLSLKHKSDLQESKIDTKVDEIDPKSLETNSRVHETAPKVQLMDKFCELEPKSHPIAEVSQIVSFVSKDRKTKPEKDKDLDVSINILDPKRFKSPMKSVPMNPVEPMDYDVTYCETLATTCVPEESKENAPNNTPDNSQSLVIGHKSSPTKSPLAEYRNITNVLPTARDADSSLSLLGGHVLDKPTCHALDKPTCHVLDKPTCHALDKPTCHALDKPAKGPLVKRTTPPEPVYKLPTVRRKADKMALPAWLCEECTAFVQALYDDPDPSKVAAIISACSKHRGARNPARPKTPPGFWETKWHVPTGTEEFNRRNDAA